MNVPTPETEDWLSGLHVGPTRQISYRSDREFSPDCHAYTYQVGSGSTSFGITPTLSDSAGDCEMTGYFPDYRYWNDAYGQRTTHPQSGVYQIVSTFLGTSGEGNECVWKSAGNATA